MTTERRRYYRIEDRALIKYRVIPQDMLNDERRFIFLNEIKASNVHAALMGIDLKLHDMLDAVRAESKVIAEAIELMNRKLTLLERVVALENPNNGGVDYQEHQPSEISLSGGGVSLAATQPLNIGDSLAIDIVLLPSNHPMRTIGRVVDCRDTDTGKYAIAIEFIEMREDDRDMLVQHVLRKQSADLRVNRRHDAA